MTELFMDYTPVFEALVAGVFASGGDGDGLLIIKQNSFREVAKLFASFIDSDNWKVTIDKEDHISFSSGYDSITIASWDFEYNKDNNHFDIVIEVW